MIHPDGKDFYNRAGLLEGGNETGKTVPLTWKMHQFMKANPGAWGMMVRKNYSDLKDTMVRTYEGKILEYPLGHPWCPVIKFGGENVRKYTYKKGGGELFVRGLSDNTEKDNTKSLEMDMITVNQLEELTLEQFEQLYNRCTGRAGNTKWPLFQADCNPSTHLHWILKSDILTRFKTELEDNPQNHDGENWTAYGRELRSRLEKFTGTNYWRLFLGEWRGNVGLVYPEFSEDRHVVDFEPRDAPAHWIHFRVIDFGFQAPFVCHHYAIDPSDDCWYMFKEIYISQKLVSENAARIHELQKLHNKEYNFNICDGGDPEKQKQLAQLGLPCRTAKKGKAFMIDAVRQRIVDGKLKFARNALDKKDPFLTMKNRPTCTTDEFSTYSYKPENKMKGDDSDDVPPDGRDDGVDCLGYAAVHRQIESAITYGFGFDSISLQRPL